MIGVPRAGTHRALNCLVSQALWYSHRVSFRRLRPFLCLSSGTAVTGVITVFVND